MIFLNNLSFDIYNFRKNIISFLYSKFSFKKTNFSLKKFFKNFFKLKFVFYIDKFVKNNIKKKKISSLILIYENWCYKFFFYDLIQSNVVFKNLVSLVYFKQLLMFNSWVLLNHKGCVFNFLNLISFFQMQIEKKKLIETTNKLYLQKNKLLFYNFYYFNYLNNFFLFEKNVNSIKLSVRIFLIIKSKFFCIVLNLFNLFFNLYKIILFNLFLKND